MEIEYSKSQRKTRALRLSVLVIALILIVILVHNSDFLNLRTSLSGGGLNSASILLQERNPQRITDEIVVIEMVNYDTSAQLQGARLSGGSFEEFQTEHQISTDLALVHVALAQDYADRSRLDEGMIFALEAMRIAPWEPRTHLVWGYLNQRNRNTHSAIAAFEKTIELDPALFDPHYYLGVIASGRGNPSLAIDYFNDAYQVAVNPEDQSMALAQRGSMFAVMKRWDAALKDIEQALTLNPDNYVAIWVRDALLADIEKSLEPPPNPSLESGMGVGLTN